MAILYATIHGMLEQIPAASVRLYEQELYPWMDGNAAASAVLAEIRTTGQLSPESEKALAAVLQEYTDLFVKTHA